MSHSASHKLYFSFLFINNRGRISTLSSFKEKFYSYINGEDY